ncbi:CdaR family protein [Capnocytophaga canimorsus]|uniref:CdaR family protein n=1 Tax=Capnocytophaga canimorsus TaxID=28188 RepID=UPI001BB31AC4|nr:CdaR family protein [Capnocytophaga canimorsus]
MQRIKVFFLNKKTLRFTICFMVALSLWVLAKLSKTTRKELTVAINVTNVPDDLFLIDNQSNHIKLLAEGTGFSLLNFQNKKVTEILNFQDLKKIGKNAYQLTENIGGKLKSKYLSEFKIQSTYSDSIFLTLEPRFTKKIPVKVHSQLNFEKEFQLREFQLQPDSVLVTGVKSVLDTITQINLQIHKKKSINETFEQSFTLKNSDSVHYLTPKVKVKTIVEKVSERILQVPIYVINAPENTQVKVFPTQVSVLCVGNFETLKELNPANVRVEADYENKNEQGSSLYLKVKTEIKGIKFSFLKENKVDFLIRKL